MASEDLSEEELTALVQYHNVNSIDDQGDSYDLSGWDVSDVYKELSRAMLAMPRLLAEVRRRRAADFTDEEREVLRWVRGYVNTDDVNDRRAPDAVAVLDKLLATRR